MRANKVSNLMVLESAAGFYIGRVYYNSNNINDYEPYDRVSSYMASREIAETALAEDNYIQIF